MRAGLREITPPQFVLFSIAAGVAAALLAQIFLGWWLVSGLAAVPERWRHTPTTSDGTIVGACSSRQRWWIRSSSCAFDDGPIGAGGVGWPGETGPRFCAKTSAFSRARRV